MTTSIQQQGASSSSSAQKPIGPSTHPDYAPLAPLLSSYPRQAAPLFHAYHDLVHSAAWTDVRAVDLAPSSDGGDEREEEASSSKPKNSGSGWGALIGVRPQGKQPELILPCHVADVLSVAYFESVFASLAALPHREGEGEAKEVQTAHILLAILSPDSTVVYYKLAKGLVKPVN